LALESEAPFPSDQLALATREEGAAHIAAAGWLKRCTPQGNSLLAIPEPLVPMPLKPDWSGGVSIRTSNGSFNAKKAQGLPFYRLSHGIFGLKPTLRLLAAAAYVMVISAQKNLFPQRCAARKMSNHEQVPPPQ
jgi:hypothetical protein